MKRTIPSTVEKRKSDFIFLLFINNQPLIESKLRQVQAFFVPSFFDARGPRSKSGAKQKFSAWIICLADCNDYLLSSSGRCCTLEIYIFYQVPLQIVQRDEYKRGIIY